MAGWGRNNVHFAAAASMNLQPVHDFLLGVGKTAMAELEEVDEQQLSDAEKLYRLYKGRLPSPRPPPEPLGPSLELQDYSHEFRNAVSLYLERSEDKEAADAFANSSWENVQAEADRAWAAYDGHLKRRTTTARRGTEALDHQVGTFMTSPYFEFLMELIPGGNYTSVLLGGLTLAYNAARRKKAVREKILQLFESLSDRAKETTDRIKLYRHDADLHAKSEKLYMAVLDCVHLSITWLDQNSARESFKAFFRQSGYAARLGEAKVNLGRRAKEFQSAVDFCLQKEVHEIHGGVDELKAASSAIFSLLAGFMKDFPDLLAAQLEQQAQQAQAQMPNVAPQTQFVLQHTQPQAFAISSAALQYSLAVEYHDRGQDAVARALAVLDSDITAATQHIPSLLDRERVGFMTQDPKFRSFLQGSDSAFLVLYELDFRQQGSLSTLSHLCGLMAKTLHTQGMWTAAAFCGLHTSASATFQGGEGVIASLTLQLLASLPNDAFSSPLAPSDIERELRQGNTSMASSVFSMVLDHLRAGMVFLIIDGLHWHETEARSLASMGVIRCLGRTVTHYKYRRRGLALKVLVTNATPRQRAQFDMAAGVLTDLTMERDVLGGGFQGAEGEVLSDTVGGASRS